MVNQMYLDKANVLIEALPYIQRFNRKIIVIKYGGSAMVDEELKRNVIQDVVLLKLVGFKPIIVHGGGKEISRWVGKVGMEPKFVNGLRVTDADTMEVAEMVLNKVNKELVTMIQSLGVNAVGISGKDGGLLNVEKKLSKGEDIGFVGNIKNVNPKVLYDLLENDFLPVVCPLILHSDHPTLPDDATLQTMNQARRINRMAERDVKDWLYVDYLEGDIVKKTEFTGEIFDIVRGGLRVSLKENGAMIFIPASLIADNKSDVDFDGQNGIIFVGGKPAWRLSDEIKVRILSVNKETRSIVGAPTVGLPGVVLPNPDDQRNKR